MKKINKKYIIPFIIAAALLISGAAGVFAVGSGLAFTSDDYGAWFYMNHLQVHLLENGRDVCDGHNTLDGDTKVTGELVQYLGYSSDGETDKLGNVEPGMKYKEEIAARNGQDIPIYVRMTIRKYWVVTEKNDAGEAVASDKAPDLSPDKIHLTYGGKEYNSDDWFINEEESTSEMKTYYYKSQLAPEADTPALFDSLSIDRGLAKKEEASRTTDPDTGVTKITYKYKYNGYAFIIKADVQAIQTHNIEDAIHSQWGVSNIKVSDDKLELK